MKFRKIITVALSITYSIIILILTLIMIRHAYIERGYFAVGGEWMGLLTIPIVIGCIIECYFADKHNQSKENV